MSELTNSAALANRALSKDPIYVHIAHRIRERRAELGLTYLDVAKRAGIRSYQVEKLENLFSASTAPSRLVAIAKALDVPPLYFFEGYEEDLKPVISRSSVDARLADALTDKDGAMFLAWVQSMEPSIRRKFCDLTIEVGGNHFKL